MEEKQETEEDNPWAVAREEEKKPEKPRFKRFRDGFSKVRPEKKPITEWKQTRRRLRMPTVRAFECLVAFVLILFYLALSVTTVPTNPGALLLFIPTMWILLSFLRRETQ